MIMPAWLLLIWSGLAATCAAAVTARAIGGVSSAPWSLAPMPRSPLHGALWSLVAGLAAYPLLYGLIFEALHRADVPVGLALGLVHAVILFAFVRQRDTSRAAFRAAVPQVIYAAVLGFLYVTP